MATKRNLTPARFMAAALLLAAAFAAAQNIDQAKVNDDLEGGPVPAQKLPATTSSAASARYFEKGMVQYENHRWNFALADWREAVRLDPNFALAHAWISMTTTDPAEESSHRELAKAAMKSASPAEQLVVRWMAGIHENRYLEGIAAMNDALAKYPRDKRLNFLFGYWLFKQDQYERAEQLTINALAEDSNYATAYNQMGYINSRRGNYAKALENAAKYVRLLPNEPNPHDSYAEMLRLSGRYEEALEHYRIALKIDPTFYISQKELGETYAIMGQHEKAREEYAKAIHDAPSDGLKAEYLQKSAMTYVRARQWAEADKAYLEAAEKARAMKQWIWEARAYRVMAMYERDQAMATANLAKAEALLAERKDLVAQADLDEEQARVWRVRAERAVASGNLSAAKQAVERLSQMAKLSGSANIEQTYHGAAGRLLLAQRKYPAAQQHLEADPANPLSLKLLVTAYEKNKARVEARSLLKRLQEWRIPSIEESLVVPEVKEAAVVSRK